MDSNKTDDLTIQEEEKKEGESVPEEEEDSFSTLFNESVVSFRPGEIVTGKVVEVGDDLIAVDINYKTEGFFPTSEVKEKGGEVPLNVGDEVVVQFERIDHSSGMVILSKTKADKAKLWEDLQKAYDEGTYVRGVVTGRVKGGFEVNVGTKAFLPGSQADIRQLRDPDSLVGVEDQFKVLKFNRQKQNVVISRRAYMEEARKSKRKEILDNLTDGEILDGKVKNITDYGVFIDLGGIDGLMHITDMSYGKISHPSELVKVGEELKVMVIRFDKERERVSLGLKQLKEDPWSLVGEKYEEGQRVFGVVTNITKYGAFIEIEEGVEGLLHVSEMSWSKKMKHPSDILSIGDRVEVVMLRISDTMRKISLGLKQLSPNPWEVIREKCPEGSCAEGTVKSITDFGIFIDLGEEIDGLVHISDMSWNQRIKHPAELYRKGDRIKVKVLKIDHEHQKFSLGIKQLKEDPWIDIGRRYRKGSIVTGKVMSLADFGAFIELEEGIEGLVHISEIGGEDVKTPGDALKIGDVVSALITSVEKDKRKLSLSIKAYQKALEKKEMEAYIEGEDETVSVLGEALKEKLKLNGDG